MSIYHLHPKDVIAWLMKASADAGEDGNIAEMEKLDNITDQLKEIFSFDLEFEPVDYGEATGEGYITVKRS